MPMLLQCVFITFAVCVYYCRTYYKAVCRVCLLLHAEFVLESPGML